MIVAWDKAISWKCAVVSPEESIPDARASCHDTLPVGLGFRIRIILPPGVTYPELVGRISISQFAGLKAWTGFDVAPAVNMIPTQINTAIVQIPMRLIHP